MKIPVFSIRRKIALITAVSTVITTLIGVSLIYLFGSKFLTETIGKEYSQIAENLGVYMSQALNDEVDDAKTYATRSLWKGAAREKGAEYGSMDKESIARYLEDMDKKWANADVDSAILKEYLGNRVSLAMRESVKVRKNIAEIFITDKYGGLVSASNKTSDFYQADEDWWKAAYNNGRGDVFVGEIEFDLPSNDWVIPIAVPLMDDGKDLVGICKYAISISRLFGSLNTFRLGDTGHAVLIEGTGRALFHHGIGDMTEYIFSEKETHELFSPDGKRYMRIANESLHDKNMFLAFARISPPYLGKKGVVWIAMVLQEEVELSRILNRFMMLLVVVGVFMLALIVPIGLFLGRLITDPIQRLHDATEHFMKGDLDYLILVKTGDEIEEFAATFRKMITQIKDKQRELQDFSNGLEVKVKERTKELDVAQEATLNLLEDLQASKEALERTNRDLVRLDELKSEFISTVSHELRTPLSIIKEGISLVLDKIPGDLNEKQAKILDISKYNIDRLARIIDGLLDLSKIEAGKVELKRNLIDISDVVRQAASSFEPKAREKGLEIRVDIDKIAGSVWADGDRITQVLTNLIGNSVKFTNSGHIDISCKDKGDGVVCSVSDTGPGIGKDDLPKVFHKFQQFNRVAGAGDKGTGLGLSIAKNIIDMHNGTIWVESEPGKGTKFTFKLHKYTAQSLFKEYVAKAVKIAADKRSEMSIIAVHAQLTGKDELDMMSKRCSDIMHEISRKINSALRREADEVVNSGSEMLVILSDCDKESAARVQFRLEEIIGKYLADQNMADIIKINYGYVTYPDDAKSDLALIEKAKAALALSAKA